MKTELEFLRKLEELLVDMKEHAFCSEGHILFLDGYDDIMSLIKDRILNLETML